MTVEKARFLAINKLKWQMIHGYRDYYTKEEVDIVAEEIYRLHNKFK